MPIRFDNTYARLPERMYVRQAPLPVAAPRLVRLNQGLARELGLDEAELRSPDGVAMLGGNRIPAGAEPLAQAYAGHQFGQFNSAQSVKFMSPPEAPCSGASLTLRIAGILTDATPWTASAMTTIQ